MVSFDIDFWLCDALSSETPPPPLPPPLLPEFDVTFAIVAYDCVDGKNAIAFECNSDVDDFDAVEPGGQFAIGLLTIIHGFGGCFTP